MTGRVSPDRAAELAVLEQAATPGPWFRSGLPWDKNATLVWNAEDPHGALLICDTTPDENHEVENWERAEGDAAFIAAARTALPDLLADLADARAALEIAAKTAHADDDSQWGYDAAGIHCYSPDHADSCRYCRALAGLGFKEDS